MSYDGEGLAAAGLAAAAGTRIMDSKDHTMQGCSSIGRALVSKTSGWEFKSLRPCFVIRLSRMRVKKASSGPDEDAHCRAIT